MSNTDSTAKERTHALSISSGEAPPRTGRVEQLTDDDSTIDDGLQSRVTHAVATELALWSRAVIKDFYTS